MIRPRLTPSNDSSINLLPRTPAVHTEVPASNCCFSPSTSTTKPFSLQATIEWQF